MQASLMYVNRNLKIDPKLLLESSTLYYFGEKVCDYHVLKTLCEKQVLCSWQYVCTSLVGVVSKVVLYRKELQW